MLDPQTGEQATFLFTAKDNRGVPGRFDYWEGSDGHVFLGNVPDDLAPHYVGGYQRIPVDERELTEMAKVDAYRLAPVQRLVPEGRFLEIGPWIGLVSYSALQKGYDVSALEMDQRCVDLLNGVGVKTTQTTDPANALTQSSEKYDVIGLWHSIEHLPKPWDVIDAAAKALAPGGILVIAAPNPESAQMRLLRERWLHLDAPRHLHLLPISSFELIGARNGLVSVERTTDDELGRILERDGWAFEIARQAFNIPVLRGIWYRLRRGYGRKHRRPGALDGAGFTLIMQRPR